MKNLLKEEMKMVLNDSLKCGDLSKELKQRIAFYLSMAMDEIQEAEDRRKARNEEVGE